MKSANLFPSMPIRPDDVQVQDFGWVDIDGYMIRPFHFDSTKIYPVVMTVYGDLNHTMFSTSLRRWLQQWLAQNGYICVNINNRGVANYGSKFMKIVYKQLGKWESNDFAEAARYLATLPYVDRSRMAIMGTSYGGYSTTYTLLTHPGVSRQALPIPRSQTGGYTTISILSGIWRR